MANTLNKVVSGGIKDGEVKTDDIADENVTLAKLEHGTSGNNGKFLRANNGGDPTWETVSTTPEGTAILSTGETGGTKFLREDGDNSCSWQSVPAGATLSGTTDNTIVTVTGANAMQGEANLTFDGTDLSVTGKILVGTTALGANADDLCLSTAANTGLSIKSGTTSAGNIYFADGTSGTDLYRGYVSYDHNTDRLVAGTANTTALTIDSSGNIEADIGNIVIGTSGKGIDFTATSGTGTSELFDDYEEGDWTPTSPASTASSNSGKYTKIGRHVFFEGSLTFGSESGNNRALIEGLPFAASGSYGGGYIRYTNVNPGEEWFSLDIPGGDDHIEMNESSPDSIKRNDVSTKRIDFCGQYIA